MYLVATSMLVQGGAVLSQTNNNTLNVYISWNVLSGNSASNGGAIFIEGGRLALLFGNQLDKNEAGTNGGAVFIVSSIPLHHPHRVACNVCTTEKHRMYASAAARGNREAQIAA